MRSQTEVIVLDEIPAETKISSFKHVEVEAHVKKREDEFRLVVDKIRVLPYGETIHMAW